MNVKPPKNFKQMTIYVAHQWAVKNQCKLKWCPQERKTVIVRMH